MERALLQRQISPPLSAAVNLVEEWEEHARSELLDQTFEQGNLHIDAITDRLSSGSALLNQPQGNVTGLGNLPQSARRGGSARGSSRGVGGNPNRNSLDPGGSGLRVSLGDPAPPMGVDSLSGQQDVTEDSGVDMGDSSHIFPLLESLREDEAYEEQRSHPDPDSNPNPDPSEGGQRYSAEGTRGGGSHGDNNDPFNDRYIYEGMGVLVYLYTLCRFKYVYVEIMNMLIYVSIYIYIYMYVNADIYVYMHVFMLMYTLTCIH
jgi:hypothetical protein